MTFKYYFAHSFGRGEGYIDAVTHAEAVRMVRAMLGNALEELEVGVAPADEVQDEEELVA